MHHYNLLEKIVGKEILVDSLRYREINFLKENNTRLLAELNNGFHSKHEIRYYMEKIIWKDIDDSVDISVPIYSDFGKHITFGKNIIISSNVTFIDLGGISIEDDVVVDTGVRLITVNQLIDPKKRRGIKAEPILLKKNSWIGPNSTILPGVTIGENSIVTADSTVTKDVPDNVIVAGSPAEIVERIEPSSEINSV